MNASHRIPLLFSGLTLLVIAACSSTGNGSSSSSSSSSSGDAAAPFTVTPAEAKVATCRGTTFVAAPSDKVTWTLEGEGTLTDGAYQAPIRVPAPAAATVKASRDGASATANVTLATAFPEANIDIARVTTNVIPDFAHGVAARGARVYGLVQGAPGNVALAKSTDGGLTFTTPATVAAGQNAKAFGVAIDAGDDETVHVVVHEESDTFGSILSVYTSTDGGKTFTAHRLYTGGNGDVQDADIVSGAAGAVTVSAPTSWQDGDGHQGGELLIWTDTAKAAGFKALDDLGNGYNAKWSPGIKLQFADKRLVEANDLRGGPHLATNGKGKVCLTYANYDINGNDEFHAVHCSTDGGKTFGDGVTAQSGKPANLSRPRLAVGPDGSLVVIAFNTWVDGALEKGPQTKYMVSTDGGATFGAAKAHPDEKNSDGNVRVLVDAEVMIDAAGVIWFARSIDGAVVQVDKSCDKGTTLSGSFMLPVTGTHRNGLLFESSAGIFGGAIRIGASDTGISVVRLLAP